MLPAEDVQRQIAVRVVVAVEKPPLLRPMQRVIGRIQVQHDLPRCLAVRFQKQIHEQPLQRLRSVPISSSAPASEVTCPPSNAATTRRRPTHENCSCSALHCVRIGSPFGLQQNSFWYNKFYSPREPMHSLIVRNPG